MASSDPSTPATLPGVFDSRYWLPEVYEELRGLAAARMARESAGQTLQPTALVHEAWLRLGKGAERKWNDREHFFRAAALAMRRILVERARRKSRQRRDGLAIRVDIEAFDLAGIPPDDCLLLLDENLKRLEKEDPASARVILLKFFAGLTSKEIADTLGVSLRSAERQWTYAKARLLDLIRSEYD